MKTTPACTACGTILPLDVRREFDAECPRSRCRRQNDPAEVVL
jgi:hypothetical protein